jgi:hypothetical protein
MAPASLTKDLRFTPEVDRRRQHRQCLKLHP